MKWVTGIGLDEDVRVTSQSSFQMHSLLHWTQATKESPFPVTECVKGKIPCTVNPRDSESRGASSTMFVVYESQFELV